MIDSDRHDAATASRDFAYEAKTLGKYLNVGRKYRLYCLVSPIVTFATGICYSYRENNYDVFVLMKQNVVHYSYAEQGYGLVVFVL